MTIGTSSTSALSWDGYAANQRIRLPGSAVRRFLAAIVGTRPELNLRNRWWHRLVLVTFFPLMVAVAILVTALQGGPNGGNLALDQRVVITDLLSFVEAFKGSGDPIVAFDAEDGWLGVGSAGNQSRSILGGLAMVRDQIACKSGGSVFGGATGELYIVGSQRGGVGIEPLPNRPGQNAGVSESRCWGPADLKDVPISDIIKYRPSVTATLMKWLRSGLIGGVVAVGLAFALALLYYRGFVYVAFGPRQTSKAANRTEPTRG